MVVCATNRWPPEMFAPNIAIGGKALGRPSGWLCGLAGGFATIAAALITVSVRNRHGVASGLPDV